MNQNIPLVSISLITYNSSRYVIEALESIRVQSYPLLELIVSDDCSTDNTIEICQGWINQNKERFVRTKIIVSDSNRGISANYNQGMDNCTGVYVKEIAGDDLLLPNCISDYVDFVTNNKDAEFCFGRTIVFDGDEKRRAIARSCFDYSAFNISQKEQYDRLLTGGNFICSATFFYNRESMYRLNIRNDERIPMMEDWPKWVNILSKGGKLSFLDKEVAMYRMSNTALSSQHTASSLWLKQFALFELLYRQPYASRMNVKKRRIWRRKLNAKQVIEYKWYRALLLNLYDCCVKLYHHL